MRLIFMGSPEYAVPSLRAIYEAGHDVVAVVSQPARRAGRGKRVQPTPVAAAAEELDIETLTPERADDEEFISRVREMSPDIIVVVAYGQILRESLLSLPKHGCINAHASLLPRWRGATPLSAAILAGDEYSGVTLIKMVKKLDAGPMIVKVPARVRPRSTSGTLHDSLKMLSASTLVMYLDALEDGRAYPPPEDQDESEMTYAPRLEKGAGQIDWSQSAKDIDRHVRAMTPWPGAYSYLGGYDGKRIKVLNAWVDREYEKSIEVSIAPGTVVTADATNGIVVAAGSGHLRLSCLQLPGRKALGAEEFAQGRGMAAGDRLW